MATQQGAISGKLGIEMARGWESKDVESQLESAQSAGTAGRKRKSIKELEVEQKRRSFDLSRRRVMHDLEEARHPRYKEQLRRALAYLDEELKKLAAPAQ